MDMYSNSGTTMLVEKKSWIDETEIEDTPIISSFVLLENSDKFNVDEKSFNLDILGQPMFTWVARACPSIPVTIQTNGISNPLELIRPYLKDADYTVVLYSDTPLVKKSTIEEIIDYVRNKGLNVCKLSRGWVYKTEYIKRVGEVFAPQTYKFNEDEFMCVDDHFSMQKARQILKNRILDFHSKNGVIFTSPELVEIDANVTIGKNTILSGHCRISSKTQIGENCKLVDCKINSSKVCERTTILGAVVDKSVIENDCLIDNKTIVADRSLVQKNTIIGKNNNITKTSIGENVKIGDNNIITSARIHDLCTIENVNILAGEEQKTIKILSNSCIGSGCKVNCGVMVGEGVIISNFKTIMHSLRQGENND